MSHIKDLELVFSIYAINAVSYIREFFLKRGASTIFQSIVVELEHLILYFYWYFNVLINYSRHCGVTYRPHHTPNGKVIRVTHVMNLGVEPTCYT